MFKNNDSVSFIATLDAFASRAFYEGVLGLKLIVCENCKTHIPKWKNPQYCPSCGDGK